MNYCETVIRELDTEFDTHKFIERYIILYEKEYVELLNSHVNVKNGIFRAANAEIGRFLTNNTDDFKIEKLEVIKSENIKNYDSTNQKWKKYGF